MQTCENCVTVPVPLEVGRHACQCVSLQSTAVYNAYVSVPLSGKCQASFMLLWMNRQIYTAMVLLHSLTRKVEVIIIYNNITSDTGI